MDLEIPNEWLREYIKTPATNRELANLLTLSGPTVDRIEGTGLNAIYTIEVTTNRVDAASIYGIAREVAAILPRNGKKATLNAPKLAKPTSTKQLGIKIINDPILCKRIMAIKLSGVKIGSSPDWVVNRLLAVGQRPLNNIVDITNYVMWEVGHPMHAFDYDAVAKGKIIVREAKKGERLVSLDGKEHQMVGGEVVFDNGTGEIIDLPGIMGTKNSVVTSNTKNVLLLFESCDPKRVRYASMTHGIRSQAAILNEKSPDPEIGKLAILRAINLFEDLTNAKQASLLFDINEKPFAPKIINLTKDFIDTRLGIALSKAEISSYLTPLGFKVSWKVETLKVEVPSHRLHDMEIPEDVLEEVARIYGYNSLPNKLPTGSLPQAKPQDTFRFETKIKQTLKGLGAVEVYNYSLVPREWVKHGLRLTNPLGSDTEYLRDNLRMSLVAATKANAGEKDGFHLFEMAKIYLPQKGQLPQEVVMLAGIFANTKYREAKGVVEKLLAELGVTPTYKIEDANGFQPSKRLSVYAKTAIGEFGVLEESNSVYYEFPVEKLSKSANTTRKYMPPPKYPGQVEDLTLVLPEKTKVGEIITEILKTQNIEEAALTDIYKSAHTFRVVYQSQTKTLTNDEVAEIRDKLIKNLEKKFGASLK